MAFGIGNRTVKLLTGQSPGTTTPRTTLGRGIGANLRSNLPAVTGQGQERPAAEQDRGGVFGGLRGMVRQNQDGLVRPAAQPAPAPAAERKKRPLAETDVGTLISGITSQDSPVMQTARLQGTQAAAARGLLSSSMAVQAAEQAAYEAALPLAQTQAQINASKNESRFQRQFESAQNKRDRRFEAGQNDLNRQAEIDLKNMDLAAVDRAKVADMITTAKANLESAIDAIMKNENLSAEQRESQIAQLRKRNRAWLAGIQDLYNVDISFGAPAGGTGGNGAGGGNGGGRGDGSGAGNGSGNGGGAASPGRPPADAEQGDIWTAPNGQRFVFSSAGRWAPIP